MASFSFARRLNNFLFYTRSLYFPPEKGTMAPKSVLPNHAHIVKNIGTQKTNLYALFGRTISTLMSYTQRYDVTQENMF